MSKSICANDRRIERFGNKHAGLSFLFSCNEKRCGNPEHYKNYLMFNAPMDGKLGVGLTFVMCEYYKEKPERILGFVTLKASALVSEGENGNIDGEPAIEISELAVDKEYEGQGIGTALLHFAAYTCKIVREEYVAVKYLVVCAEPKAVDFYCKTMGFSKVNDYYNIPREQWNGTCVPMFLRVCDE